MEFSELTAFGTGQYDIGITVEPMPHLRASRYSDDGFREGITMLARLKGGVLLGTDKENCFEANLMAPWGVEDHAGDNVILTSFEFHSFQIESARSGLMYFKGFLSGADAHPQSVYDRVKGLTTTEEFEAVEELTSSTGRLKYMPPLWEEAQQFIGYRARLTMRPYNLYVPPTA